MGGGHGALPAWVLRRGSPSVWRGAAGTGPAENPGKPALSAGARLVAGSGCRKGASKPRWPCPNIHGNSLVSIRKWFPG